MTTQSLPLFAAVLGVSAIIFASTASAEVVWEFPDNPTNCVGTTGPSGACGGGDGNLAATRTYAGDDGAGTAGTQVTVSGWSNTADLNGGTNNAVQQGQITHYSGGLGVQNADAVDYNEVNPSTSTQTNLGTGNLNDEEKVVLAAWETQFGVQFGNLGSYLDNSEDDVVQGLLDPLKDAGEQASPEHAVDNDDRVDFVLFDFGDEEISLSHVKLGWWQHDADISVLAYNSDNPLALDGLEYSASSETLTDNGWEVVGNYSNVQDEHNDTQVIDTETKSSYWIVAAFNQAFAQAGTGQAHWSNGNDYFKIEAVSGAIHVPGPDPSPAPAPGTVLLLVSGLAGLVAKRRLRSGLTY